MTPRPPLPTVILISGRGSNLRAILDQVRLGTLPLDIRAVISNRPAASGLRFAHEAGIPTLVLDHELFPRREVFEMALLGLIEAQQPSLVILAGFMRILGSGFVTHFQGKMLNIHPSLLPNFPGLATHLRALAAGAQWHGASVHFVTPAVDGGPVILQARVPVVPGDTAKTLAARVLEQEHIIFPQVLRWFAAGRLQLDVSQGVALAMLDNVRLGPGGVTLANE